VKSWFKNPEKVAFASTVSRSSLFCAFFLFVSIPMGNPLQLFIAEKAKSLKELFRLQELDPNKELSRLQKSCSGSKN
jgi:hypothetical protein